MKGNKFHHRWVNIDAGIIGVEMGGINEIGNRSALENISGRGDGRCVVVSVDWRTGARMYAEVKQPGNEGTPL